MRLLVDANLSPSVAAQLRAAGHDAVHVIDVELATATDPAIVEHSQHWSSPTWQPSPMTSNDGAIVSLGPDHLRVRRLLLA